MRLAVAFALLAVAGAAHASVHTDVQNNKEHRPVEAAADHNLLRGRHASVSTKTTSTRRRRHRHRNLQTNDEPAETKWDNNRISDTNPDGVPLDAADKPDCWPSCYSHHYDGPVDVGNVEVAEVNRVVDVPNPADDAVEQAALQLALAEAQAVTATRDKPNPHIVYDYSTGYKYDLSTGQKIVIEEVEHTNVSTGQEQVDVKVYIVEGLPDAGADAPLAVPGSGPLDDPTPPQTCTKGRDDETCTAHSQCESGCCATLATKVKCVEPRLPIFKQYCPVANPCRDDAESAGTMIPEVASKPQQPAQGGEPAKPTYVHSAYPKPGGGNSDTDGETDTGGTLYTVGTFTTGGGDPSNPSNPNRVVGGGQGADNGSATAAAAVDCAMAKKDDWPMGKVPTQNQCEGSCQCKSGCCVKYWAQICVDKTANEGRWADSCV